MWNTFIPAAGLFLALQILYPNPQAVPANTRSTPPPRWTKSVDRARALLRAAIAKQDVPGISVAVAAGGELVWSEGFGYANLDARHPVTPTTRFRIGTASPIFTSVAVGALVDKGSLKLENNIQTYVPKLPTQPSSATLRQMMTHTQDAAPDAPLLRQRCEHPADALPHLTNPAQNHPWILVSAAIESATGQPFLAYMRDRYFQPLKMDNTGAQSTTAENPEHIGEESEDPPFLTAFRHKVLEPLGIVEKIVPPATDPAILYLPGLQPMPGRNLSCYSGSLAFYSTPTDLVRFRLSRNASALPQPIYNGDLFGQRVASLLTVADTGIVVAVLSNAASADTPTLARKVAEAFAPAPSDAK